MESAEESLETLGLLAFDDVFLDAPEETLHLEFPESCGPPNFSVSRRLAELLRSIEDGDSSLIFTGAGCYDHFVPIAIENMTAQTDFYSAYRAKSSEGTRTILSALVRCQKRVANLTQTDVVDVSVYCGGTPLARACSLAAEATERKILLLPSTLNPDQLKAVQRYADAGLFELRVIPEKNGLVDLDALTRFLNDEKVAAVVVQYPNFYGNLERLSQIVSLTKTAGALVIMSVELIALSALKPPGEWGADLVVADSLPYASPLDFSQPRLGAIAASRDFEYSLPRHLLREVDSLTKVSENAFLLHTAENASDAWKSSFSPSRAILDATLALMFFAYMSQEELYKAAVASHRIAKYARAKLAKVGFQFHHEAPFLHEFAVKVDDPHGMNQYLLQWGIVGGFELDDGLLFAFTEKRSPEEVDELVYFMKEFQFGAESSASE